MEHFIQLLQNFLRKTLLNKANVLFFKAVWALLFEFTQQAIKMFLSCASTIEVADFSMALF